MKLLFDQNISYRAIRKISQLYPEARQVRELGFEDSTDLQIWDFAKKNGYTSFHFIFNSSMRLVAINILTIIDVSSIV